MHVHAALSDWMMLMQSALRAQKLGLVQCMLLRLIT